jgi:hypothetical protein
VGNRLTLTTTLDVVNYQYDDANRLTSVNGQAYTWDNNGNLLSDGVRTYTYTHANRLTQVVSGTLTTEFTYPSTSSGQATAQATAWPRPWTASPPAMCWIRRRA